MMLLILVLSIIGLTSGQVTLVSIDVGTEFMKVGIVKPGVPIDVVLNTESKRKTPMAVYMKGDERLFGDNALTRGMKAPQNTYMHLLDLLGKKVDNPVVQKFQQRFPHNKIEADPVRGTVIFRHDQKTFYSVEELLAMQLQNAVITAENYGGSPVSKVLICVPPFFNQIERNAMLDVADIAGLSVLQLMNSNAAVALQYAVFRNIEMTEKPFIILFADVGSQSTTATVVSYSLVKDKVTSEKTPTVQIMGVGYDRDLGGFEVDLRLVDYLAEQFTLKYPKLSDIRKNARAMAKLMKEAKKVKTVLSANAETFAQIETLHEDKDFRTKMSREVLEELCKDLYPRFDAPFEEAIATAGVGKEEIEQVVLFGAGTRVPRIQDQLLQVTGKKEVHKFINTDEAAAMGSAFMAASSSQVYRTKEIKLKDSNNFPFHVSFFKHTLSEEGEITEKKLINKELYYRNNGIPQKKAMTYTKFNDDFHFNISYGSLGFLSEQQTSEFGDLELMSINVKGVQDIYNQHHDKTSKGIKAHLMVDESGMISVDLVEAIFETIPSNKTESGWLDSAINFFGKGEEEVKEGEAVKEGEEKKEEKKEDKKNDTDKKNSTVTNTTANSTVPEKPVTIKERLDLDFVYYGILRLASVAPGKAKLAALKKVDDDKRATEMSRNQLESFVINTKDLFTSDVYIAASTDAEKEKIMKVLSDESNWLEEESWGETFVVFNQRLATLEDYVEPITFRVQEAETRPHAIADLKQAFNLTERFLAKMANVSEELRYHTVLELDNLEKLMNTTKDWVSTSQSKQSSLPANTAPVVKVAEMKAKRISLERDLYYLIRKPIPQWYKDKIAEMAKNKTANATKEEKVEVKPEEGEKKEEKKEEAKVTDDDLVVEDEKKTEEKKSEL